jgi:diguanylate cyclase (GGDEF)-like protein
MHPGSIVKLSTRKARRAVFAALVGVAIVAGCFLTERFAFEEQFSQASLRLLRAQLATSQIRLADERLTMSANMAAATGDRAWIRRYDENLPLINTAIAEASIIAPPAATARFDAATRASNDRLVELEREAFIKVGAGDLREANAILRSHEYAMHKRILQEGTDQLIIAVIAGVNADLAAVKQRALLLAIGLLMASLGGGFTLWRRFNASLMKSETTFLETEAQIRRLAMNDVLTGLANRTFMRHALQTAIESAAKRNTKLAVLMIDLDRFKPINDKHGHLVGDLVLKTAAARLAGALREGDRCSRHGGDEFVALIEYETDDEIPRSLASRVIEGLSSPMIIDGTTHQIGASVGFAICPTHAVEEEDLIRKADIALYRAKLSGRGQFRVFDPSLDVDSDARAHLEQALRHGIESGEIVPYFQPLIDLTTGRLYGFEVLNCWRHPVRGLLTPDKFMAIAEKTGQITDVMIAVIRQACSDATVLPREFALAINISPQQLQDEGLAAKVMGALSDTGFAPHRLEVELTEQALVTDIALAKQVICSLKRHGIRVALDGFGVGYSSLGYLAELPFDTLKIDRSFIETLHDRPESIKIVAAIIGLSTSLGLATVAEGVEVERDAILLRQLGCDFSQGYRYSKLIPAEDLPALLARFSASTSGRMSA